MSTVDQSMDTVLTSGEKIGLYGKALAGAVVAAMGAYSTALQDGPGVTGVEWIGVALAFLGSFGLIWAVPFTPAVVATYGKLVVAGLVALLSSLGTGLIDGSLSQHEIVTAIIALAAAAGLTGSVSNAASSDPVVNGRQVGVKAHTKRALIVPAADDLTD